MSKVQSKQSFKWMLLVAAGMVLPLLVVLGFWQLERAEQKQQLIESWSEPQQYSALPSDSEMLAERYLPVQLTGSFDLKHYFLLDNRQREGTVGYEVIAVFRIDGHQNLLVNLGWIRGGNQRSVLPIIQLPAGEVQISGGVRLISPAFTLKDSTLLLTWPVVIQALEPEKMSELLQTSLLPYELKVSQAVLPELDLNWPLNVMMPEKHLAYAAQWFLMAMVLCGLIIWASRRVAKEAAYE